MRRRSFLRLGVTGAGAAAASGTVIGRAAAELAQPGPGPYGTLEGRPIDNNGLRLPRGFSSRVIATSGETVGDTNFAWHLYPDGAATFGAVTEGGTEVDGEAAGWIYVCNSEVPSPAGYGGASAIRFDADGEIVDAYSVLDETSSNCAGGPTPWGTWLSCEERNNGQVWECDPTGSRSGTVRPALGLFAHEAAAVDPVREQLYLTEDSPDGRFYRFTPRRYPDLARGVLEAAEVAPDGSVSWMRVPDPELESGDVPTALQVPTATLFAGGEGVWYHDDRVFFTTKTDDRVHALDVAEDRYEVVYDAREFGAGAPLRGVDNVTVETGSGDLYVAEDGGDLQVAIISAEGEVTPFVQVVDDLDLAPASEITGPCFSPDGTRLYFSSQRGGPNKASDILADVAYGDDGARAGITYEITGPFRGVVAPASEAAQPADAGSSESGQGLLAPALAFGGGGAAVLAGAAGASAVLSRRRRLGG